MLAAIAHLPETGAGGYPFPLIAAIAVGAGLLITASTPSKDFQGAEMVAAQPLNYEYDPAAVKDYFAGRPLAVLRRRTQVGS